jgi:short subunit dehydrogenase-like uncharacterized protein
MSTNFLIFGSTGYSGDLIAREAVRRGLHPILAGRNPVKVEAQARELGLDYRILELNEADALSQAFAEVGAVLHCAGPFIHTSLPVVEACLKVGTHYLDITGEIPVYERLAALDEQARQRSITLLPGVGLEIVPSDCLAAHLKQRLPSATHLALASVTRGRSPLSQGTLKTMIEFVDYGGRIRQNGQLKKVPMAWKSRQIDFGSGPRKATTFPWPDVFTAYYTTGIPNIESLVVWSKQIQGRLTAMRYLRPLVRLTPVKKLLQRGVESLPAGPTAEERARARTIVWGEVIDDQGRQAVSILEGPEGYTWTAITAVSAVQKILAESAPAGFQTPALAFGADFILEDGGVTRQDT